MSTEDRVNDILAHHGVKGMKWGVTRSGHISATTAKTGKLSRHPTDITVKQKPGTFVKTTGGKKQIASEDAIKTAASRQLAKKSTTDALSTKQLQDAVFRMNMEQQYAQLVKKSDRRTRGQRFVQTVLGGGKSQNLNGNSQQTNAVGDALKKAVKTAVTTAAVA